MTEVNTWPAGPHGTLTAIVAADEPAFRKLLQSSLMENGFAVTEVEAGWQAVDSLRRQACDLVVLDMTMAGVGSLEACSQIRAVTPRIKIVMVAAAGADEDRVRALDAGADDCVSRPLQFQELVARVRALLRRAAPNVAMRPAQLQVGNWKMDFERCSLWRAGKEVFLSPKEFELLVVLMKNEGSPLERSHLLRAVWGAERVNQPEHLRTYINRLRKKIEDDPHQPQCILTEPWFGYRFRIPSEPYDVPPANRKTTESPDDYRTRGPGFLGYNQDQLDGLGIDELRKAIRANSVSFPSQVPIFHRHDRPDLQGKLVPLYFVLGWECQNIAARYRIAPQRVRMILNTWKRRAVQMGYIQYIPPPEVLQMAALKHGTINRDPGPKHSDARKTGIGSPCSCLP